jgi:opacity protein-like surface antigen
MTSRQRQPCQIVRLQAPVRIALFRCACGLAGCVSAACAFAQGEPSSNDDTWHFAVTPYLWMAGMNGSTRIGALSAENVDASFSDVVGNISAGFMGAFEARKNRWVILLNTFYVGLSDTSGPLLGGQLGNVKLELNQTILGLGGAYRVIEDGNSFVDVGLGVRYVNLDTHINFSQSSLLPNGRANSEGVNWTDAIVAIRGAKSLSSRWALYGYADLGTGGSKWSGQLLGGAQYKWSRSIKLDLGYRILAEDYDTSGFLYDIRTEGPYLGVRIEFGK